MYKDVYQFAMMRGKLREPFTVYTMLPRAPVPLSECALHSLNITSLLVVELDLEANFFAFFQ